MIFSEFFVRYLFSNRTVKNYRNENNEIIIRKFTSWAVMNGLSGLYSYKYTPDRWQYTTTMVEHMRQTTRGDSALPCGLHWVRVRVTEHNATLCTFFILLLFLTSLHLFTIAKHYFTAILQYSVAGCLFQWFFAETRFWSFSLFEYIYIMERES